MTDEQRGLGHVVYSTESDETLEERKDTTGPTDVVEEGSRESFPASDPPGYATGTADVPAEEVEGRGSNTDENQKGDPAR